MQQQLELDSADEPVEHAERHARQLSEHAQLEPTEQPPVHPLFIRELELVSEQQEPSEWWAERLERALRLLDSKWVTDSERLAAFHARAKLRRKPRQL